MNFLARQLMLKAIYISNKELPEDELDKRTKRILEEVDRNKSIGFIRSEDVELIKDVFLPPSTK